MGMGNQVFQSTYRQIGVDGKNIGLGAGNHDRLQVALRIIGQPGHKLDEGQRAVERQEHRVAVWRGAGNLGGCDGAGGSRNVFDDHRLVQAVP